MLLERRLRLIRGVRVLQRTDGPFALQIVPMRRLSLDEVDRLVRRLPEADGPIVTSALSTIEQGPFRDYGFIEFEALHLFRHSFAPPPRRSSPATIRNARRSDLRHVLAIDGECFEPFWTLDRAGIESARKATPVHRYVVAEIDGQVVGYAIAGHAGSPSFLQRLAVHPDMQGQGIGGHLVSDAVEWAMGRRALNMMVNTQVSNQGATALYERLGFVLDPDQLNVLELPR
jgi:ribosomal-protein-alanine N-acetyltransferase